MGVLKESLFFLQDDCVMGDTRALTALQVQTTMAYRPYSTVYNRAQEGTIVITKVAV